MALTAIKGNRVYTLADDEKQHYVDEGFDVYDAKGKVVAYGKGKTVPYETYLALKAELEALKKAKKAK